MLGLGLGITGIFGGGGFTMASLFIAGQAGFLMGGCTPDPFTVGQLVQGREGFLMGSAENGGA